MVHSKTQSPSSSSNDSRLSFDSFRLTELLAKELVGFISLAVVVVLVLSVLIVTFQSLILIGSNGRIDVWGMRLEPGIAVSVALIMYTFHVWRTDHTNCRDRVAIQWFVWSVLLS